MGQQQSSNTCNAVYILLPDAGLFLFNSAGRLFNNTSNLPLLSRAGKHFFPCAAFPRWLCMVVIKMLLISAFCLADGIMNDVFQPTAAQQ
jgi:ABC-type polysaccharide transport system permease subunit